MSCPHGGHCKRLKEVYCYQLCIFHNACSYDLVHDLRVQAPALQETLLQHLSQRLDSLEASSTARVMAAADHVSTLLRRVESLAAEAAAKPADVSAQMQDLLIATATLEAKLAAVERSVMHTQQVRGRWGFC